MGPKVERHMCANIGICKSLASVLRFCILICLKPFRMALNNSYVKIISIVYRGQAERKSAKTIDIVQRHSEAEKKLFSGFGMALNNYSRLRNGAEQLFSAIPNGFRQIRMLKRSAEAINLQISLHTFVCQHFEPSAHL